MIAIGLDLRTALSGPESKSMTHFLRMKHDAILIGTRTARSDDPSLNCRYPGATEEDQPQPIIVGSSLQDEWFEVCKATKLGKEGKGKEPWSVAWRHDNSGTIEPQWWMMDEPMHAELRPTEETKSTESKLDWGEFLEDITQRGIDSIMIEGGARIINELLQRPDLVDAVIVTIAPTWLGNKGVQVSPPTVIINDVPQNAAALQEQAWKQFGADSVLCGRLRSGAVVALTPQTELG